MLAVASAAVVAVVAGGRAAWRARSGADAAASALAVAGNGGVSSASRGGPEDDDYSPTGAPTVSSAPTLPKPTDPPADSADTGEAPHILLITLDDAGWNDFGYQSTDLSTDDFTVTPHIDSLAGQGVKLKAYYGQPSCSPSRAALLAGKWVHKLGFQDIEVSFYSNYSVPLRHTLLPDRLRAEGYRTYGIGKWNIGHCNEAYLPWARGFDYFLGYFSGGMTYTTHQAGHFNYQAKGARTATEYPLFDLVEGWYDANSSAGSSLKTGAEHTGEYDTLLFRDTALEVIQQHAAIEAQSAMAGGGGTPMFMWMAMHAAHADHGTANDTYFSANEGPTLRRLNHLVMKGNMTAHRYEFARSMMLADLAIGAVVAGLKTDGLLHKTLTVVHSDNGAQSCSDVLPGFNTPLRSTKFQYFEGGVRVPGFVYAPGLLPSTAQGTEYAGMMHHVDWMATFLSLAGADWDSIAAADGLDGVDQWAAITGYYVGNTSHPTAGSDVRSPRSEIVFDINLMQEVSGGRELVDYKAAVIAYRYNDYKLLLNTSDDSWYVPSVEYDQTCSGNVCKLVLEDSGGKQGTGNCTWGAYLFDVRRDPTERHNLIYELPQVRAELEYRVRQHYESGWTQEASWTASASDAAHEAFLKADQYIVPWGCGAIY